MSTTLATESPRWLFHHLRWRLLRNNFRRISDHSAIRVITILLCSLAVWALVFWVSYEGFHFLNEKGISLRGAITGTLFDLLFLSLGVMLVFSSSIILYSSLFA